MDAEQSNLSVLNTSPDQSNGLINILNHWNQVMKQSSPVEPAKGLINAEVNDSTFLCAA